MFGKLLRGLGKAVGGFLGGPWGQLALTVAPALFGRRGGGQAGAAEQAAQAQAAEQQEAARRMMELANQIQIPPALAPTVFAKLQAQAMSQQPQLADYDAQMRALAQRAQLISGAAGLAGGAGNAYQQLAQMYRQQQAGQLAGWAQLMPQIAQLFRKPQPTQLDVARSLGKFFRGW